MSDNIYKTGREVNWNMGEAYYNMIANFKSNFASAYTNKDVELANSVIKLEWIHCRPYFYDNEEMVKLVKRIENNLSLVQKSLSQNHSKSRLGEESKKKHNAEALELLYQAESDLYVLQAKTGMLQPKSEDPVKAMRKYGD